MQQDRTADRRAAQTRQLEQSTSQPLRHWWLYMGVTACMIVLLSCGGPLLAVLHCSIQSAGHLHLQAPTLHQHAGHAYAHSHTMPGTERLLPAHPSLLTLPRSHDHIGAPTAGAPCRMHPFVPSPQADIPQAIYPAVLALLLTLLLLPPLRRSRYRWDNLRPSWLAPPPLPPPRLCS